MFKYFSSNEGLILFLIPLLALANISLEYYFTAFNVFDSHVTNLWGIDFSMITGWLNALIIVCIISANAILINYTFNNHEFYDKNTYLPSVTYLILASFFPFSILVNGELFAQTFFIIALSQLLKIKQNEDGRNHCFNCALFVGIAATFNPLYLLFLPFLWFSILSVRPFVFREYLLTVVGIIIPFMGLWLVTPDFFVKLFVFDAKLNFYRINNYLMYIPHVLVIILFIVAYRFISQRVSKSSIRFKRIMNMILYCFLFAFSANVLIFITYQSSYYFSSGAIVLAFFLPYAYLDAKAKVFPNILFYGLLVLTVIKFIL